jgi:hypothetical protein
VDSEELMATGRTLPSPPVSLFTSATPPLLLLLLLIGRGTLSWLLIGRGELSWLLID